MDTFVPTFLIQIEGKKLSADITQEITSLVFTDNEEELDVLELSITNRNLQFVDDPLFQEGNEIIARFGYAGNLSSLKHAIIKDIDYDFPESSEPTIRIKAYDKACQLAGKVNQKVWQKPAPGILYSEIATEIALKNGLTPVVVPTAGRQLRMVQSNQSDAKFLKELATKAHDTQGNAGYLFFVQNNELHFHPRRLEQKPAISLTYFTNAQGILRSFKPSTQTQGTQGAGRETKSIGIDPRKKATVTNKANNTTVPERPTLGKHTYLVNAESGQSAYQGQESGQIMANYNLSKSQHEPAKPEQQKKAAEARFKEAELKQIEATALTIGLPQLQAKSNIEIKGVGRKFSGIYYCSSVRHSIDASGYSCELKLKKNAMGSGAGKKAAPSAGQKNSKKAPLQPEKPTVALITVNADTGAVIKEEK